MWKMQQFKTALMSILSDASFIRPHLAAELTWNVTSESADHNDSSLIDYAIYYYLGPLFNKQVCSEMLLLQYHLCLSINIVLQSGVAQKALSKWMSLFFSFPTSNAEMKKQGNRFAPPFWWKRNGLWTAMNTFYSSTNLFTKMCVPISFIYIELEWIENLLCALILNGICRS